MSNLRAQLLKSNVFRSKVVEVSVPQAEGEPVTLAVRVKQPSVEERSIIFAEAKVSKSGEVNAGGTARMGALAIVFCARDPETDEPIFTTEDIDTLLHTPANSWVDKLAAEVMSLLADAAEIAKKSG